MNQFAILECAKSLEAYCLTLEDYVILFAAGTFGETWRFQQDNASTLRSKLKKNALRTTRWTFSRSQRSPLTYTLSRMFGFRLFGRCTQAVNSTTIVISLLWQWGRLGSNYLKLICRHCTVQFQDVFTRF